MTVPRELRFRDGKLYQWPVREIREYRKDKIEYSGLILHDEERVFDGVEGRSLELDLEIAPCSEGAALYREFAVKFAKDEDHYIVLSYMPGRSLLTVDRSRSGQSGELTARRSTRVSYNDGKISLRILLDRWSAEVFINGGEQVMSLTYYTPLDADSISFSADGNAALDMTAYTLGK